jgi:hypothetical protein
MIALDTRDMSRAAGQWTLLVCWCILMTTIQTQEFRDEMGDRERGRRTLVTELGRERVLWTVYVAVTFWSLHVPPTFPRHKADRPRVDTYHLDSLQVTGSLHYFPCSSAASCFSQRPGRWGMMGRGAIARCTSFGVCGWLHSFHYL